MLRNLVARRKRRATLSHMLDNLGDLLPIYLTWLIAGGSPPASVRVRAHYLSALAATLPGRSLAAATPDDLVAFLARPAWSPATRKSARSAVAGFYRWAVTTGRLDSDPAEALPPITVPPGRPRPCPDDVVHAALDRADARGRLAILTAWLQGMRRAEVAAMHTGDLEGDQLRILGKGAKVRVIPAHPDVAAQLRALPPGWAFPAAGGRHLSADRLGRLVGDLLGPGWSMHTLRHGAASRWYAATRDIVAVRDLLGHSSVSTTQLYTAMPPGAMRQAVLSPAGNA